MKEARRGRCLGGLRRVSLEGVPIADEFVINKRRSRIVHRGVHMTGSENGTLPDAPRISLTFDDGPDPIWTPRVLEALRLAQAQATFFVVAPQARRFPRLVSDILRAGHRVEFHCTQHVRHTQRTRGEVEADIVAGLQTLEVQGVRPHFWRPPWGVLAPFTAEIADEFGLEIALWTEGTCDWRGDPASEMLERVGTQLRPGSVVLMHDGIGPGARRSGCSETVALVGSLVKRIRSLGCEPGLSATTPSVRFAVETTSANGAGKADGRVRTGSLKGSREISLLTADLVRSSRRLERTQGVGNEPFQAWSGHWHTGHD